MTEAVVELNPLVQFDAIEDPKEFTRCAAELAGKQPWDLALRDSVAAKAEEKFEGGADAVKKIWTAAQLEAGDAAELARTEHEASIRKDRARLDRYLQDKAGAAAKAAEPEAALTAKAEPKPEAQPTNLPMLAPLQGEIILPVVAGGQQQVETINQKHAVIGNYGGKCAVLSWERWDLNPRIVKPSFQTLSDFKNRYMNRYVGKETEDGLKNIPAGKYWLSHPKRLQFDAVAFEPGEPVLLEGNRCNLWRGLAVVPRKGSWTLMREHIYRVLGAGDEQAGQYIERWIAWMLQNPGIPAEAVLTFRGEEGAGKGIVGRVLLKIFGIYGLPVSDQKHLLGAFSGHLQHCVFMFLDEAFWAGDVSAEGRLKSLVTEPTITIEPKYFAPFQIRNSLHIMMSSNNDWVVPARHGARRYAVFNVSSERVGDFAYFNALGTELETGGTEAMVYDLLKLDLGDWHPKQIYQTAALVEQKQHSLRGLDAWIESMLQAGALPKPHSSKYPNRCLSKHLLETAKEHDRYTNESLVAKKLHDVLGAQPFNVQYARGWVLPPLPECRAMWERRNGGSWPWHRDVTEWAHQP